MTAAGRTCTREGKNLFTKSQNRVGKSSFYLGVDKNAKVHWESLKNQNLGCCLIFVSGLHLTYCLMASTSSVSELFFSFQRDFVKSCSHVAVYRERGGGHLWEFQSISLILHLSQECCVRNQNSPHILRIINFPAIAGEYAVTAM